MIKIKRFVTGIMILVLGAVLSYATLYIGQILGYVNGLPTL